MSSYYSILGVGKDADSNQIRQAFRKKARSYHPDLNPGDQQAEAKFKEINEAYEVLSDQDSRRKYDAYGDQWKQADHIEAQRRAASSPFGFGGARRTRTAYEGDIFGGLEDIFGDLGGFGHTATPSTVRSEAEVAVSLAEAFNGTTVTANLTMGGRSRRFEVDIPPGVDNGSTVRVTPERGTELLFRVMVTPDPRFRRDGTDVYTDANVPFEDAILGGEAEVQTVDGRRIWVTIPENSQNGQNIRLRGQGMPRLGSPDSKGDLFVTVRPKMPSHLTEEERELVSMLKKLRSGEGGNHGDE